MDAAIVIALATLVVTAVGLFVTKNKRINFPWWGPGGIRGRQVPRRTEADDQRFLNADDVAEFNRIREEILASRRRELAEKEYKRDLYEPYHTLGRKIPFLCSTDWVPICPALLPLPGAKTDGDFPLIIEYDPSAENEQSRAWTDEVVEKSRRLLPRVAGTKTYLHNYAEAIGRIRRQASVPRPKRKAANPENIEDDQFYNGDCYRLLHLQLVDSHPGKSARLRLKFGICTYFDYLNTTEVLAHEYARARENGRDPDSGLSKGFQVRNAAGDWLHDLQRRYTGSGICCLTLIRTPDGRLDALMMDRSIKHVQTAMGTVHVRPAGEFQPLSKSPAHYGEQCDLWWTLLREFAEEVGGYADMRHQIRSTNDLLKYNGIGAMVEAVKQGTWKTYYLGFGFDPLNYKPEFLLCTVIKKDTFATLFPKFQPNFVEGEGFQDVGWHGTEFTDTAIDGYLRDKNILPSAMACLHLAHQHREFLLRETENWYS